MALAAAATISTQIGDTVTNPSSNVDVQVLQIITNAGGDTIYAIGDDGSVILTTTAVGDIIEKADGSYKVISNAVNPVSGLIDVVNIRIQPEVDPPVATVATDVATASGADFGVPPGAEATPGAPEVDPPALTSGVIRQVKVGGGGGSGKDGYGVKICDPTGILGCATIGYKGTDGGDGKKPADISRTIASSYNGGSPITSTASSTPGITIGSIGGNGGQGGDAYGNISARAGGDGGAGGRVFVTNNAGVNVSGTNSTGMYLFSRSGNAGKGGSGYLFSGGGSGGSARSGGTVNGTNNAQITTGGNGGHAIRAFSSGGGAGSGGGSWGVVGSAGNGAKGGNGGSVTINNNGPLITNGNDAHGVLVQSIGGSGGDAGAAGGLFASGGSGSTGGNGGSATVNNTGSITTTGDNSRGIMAQSIGGGGGSGGGAGGLVALSGSGGAAGNGSTVSITNSGNITTFGKRADAIYAQSIGGGGGSGGGAGGIVASGSSGGGAGSAGTVTINNSGTLITLDDASRGIFAQSIGGGGGSGGGSGGLVALSGTGGGAGNGSTVTVTNSGAITTGVFGTGGTASSGRDSDAIFAQSIGGGGGDGAGAGGLVASGGSGGGSGNGGVVTVTNSGALTTNDDESSGIFAQSIGGGGGAGAGSGGLVALGGAGGGSGNGNTVTVSNNAGGDIATFGERSTAIYAQSIGGGGGSGAGSGGIVAVSGKGGGSGVGGTVTISNFANVTTAGTQSRGIHAQSIGGGGGSGGGAGGLVALGGSGGGASRGGTVSVTNRGNITAGFFAGGGAESDAIFAQSVGGGGGSGAGSGGLVGVSGSGGGAGAGGNVTVINSGIINTFYEDSFGIFAQSIGGGGGAGAGAGGLVALGGSGGGAAAGGSVTVTNQSGGTITTNGDRSGAIHAQSIGGGGGNGAGSGGLVAISGAAGGAGTGGKVTVTNNSQLITRGDQSRGILAQSIGGGGGSGGGAGGLVAIGTGGGGAAAGGAVEVTSTGSITTGRLGESGAWSDAIFAQSIGGGGGSGAGSGGLVGIGGSGGGAGAGGSVKVTNSGALTTYLNDSFGIFAQSIGGGGGAGAGSGGLVALAGSGGGAASGGTVTVVNRAGADVRTFGERSGALFAQSIGGGGGDGAGSGGIVALSGSGGGNGNGAAVSLTNNSSLTTVGSESRGILAQSIGGGGGSGGGAGGLVALAGAGGGSGNGARVTVVNTGDISTGVTGVAGKKESDAIFAQSIGGGGGSGAGSGGLVALSGSGGGGGSGGEVSVNNSGDLSTWFAYSNGIFAQSVGGGGGSGLGSGGLVALGGGGSGGGNAGNVTVTSTGNIATRGDFSRGIFAQSIAGGGGSGGDSGGLVAIGGGGNSGGASGVVQVNNSGDIETRGEFSQGIFAQSIAGGGGSGGNSGGLVAIGGSSTASGDSKAVTIGNDGNIITHGPKSDGILAQSIGGGGGNAGSAGGPISIGGSASSATGSDSGVVTVNNSKAIQTYGEDSRGIFAQSVGGGGGNGGSAFSGSLFIGVGVAGAGGAGGEGNTVNINLDRAPLASAATTESFIYTKEDRSAGILAQSVGGSGGNGGDAWAISAGLYGSLSVAIGGNGGGGGEGGQVSLHGASRVLTEGDMSTGILLQSVGGGGGNGGMSVAAAVAGGDVASVAASVSLGGNAGGGNDAGKVTVSEADLIIETRGDHATGLIAQSVGGGGGNGGVSIGASVAASGGVSGAVSVGLGGSGSSGGAGGEVDVAFSGSVKTSGALSDGVLIQSIGGGGGNGGMTIAASLAAAGGGAGTIGVGLGGSAGGAGHAGKVTADIDAPIDTNGDGADGLVVQAIGGGGGSGGLSVTTGLSGAGVGAAGVSVGIGGDGAGGGNGNEVITQYNGNLITRGVNSTGILVQSVGGGGGNGGGSIAASLSGAGVGAGTVDVGLGGSGAGGGLGGAVNVDRAISLQTSGSVTTLADNSAGIIAQSIGGGGGAGGFNVTAGLAGAATGAGSVSVGIGGSGGGAGDGKNVETNISSSVDTYGNNSGAVTVQSVGGGGGTGGMTVSAAASGAGVGSGAISVGVGGTGGTGGKGGDVDARMYADIHTRGNNSQGLLVQSVGGGGGNGGLTVSASGTVAGTGSGAAAVGVGGTGGDGGISSYVSSLLEGSVFTEGKNSTAVIAQSVGGGGGNGSISITGAIAGAGTGSGGASVGIGGSGGKASDGGEVSNTVIGDINTLEEGSGGVLAQSLGGGGGNGGVTVSAAVAMAGTGSGAASVGVGGSGGGGGTSRKVTNKVTGDVTTRGDDAAAVVAQSIGGGGGNGSITVGGTFTGAGTGSGAVAVSVGGSGGDGGDGGEIDNAVTGNVYTGGNDSTGVLAQSVGGGGGNGGLSVGGAVGLGGTGTGAAAVGVGGSGAGAGNSMLVTNYVTGNVTTRGNNSGGVLAQSLGGGGGNGGIAIGGTLIAGASGGAVSVGVGGSGGGGGEGGNVFNTVIGDVYSSGLASAGVMAQSLGGGGGNGGLTIAGGVSLTGTAGGAVSVGVGGSGGSGGISRSVTNRVEGSVTTVEKNSSAVVAQSIGGGGGNGSIAIAGSLGASGNGAGAVALGIGGSGESGGNAGAVINTVIGDMFTYGQGSKGVFAQSLGGGGGTGGLSVTGAVTLSGKGGGSVGVGVGGFGGAGGDGAEVSNTVTGNVTTAGNQASGVVAQSVGGGGGDGGISIVGVVNISGGGAGGVGVSVGGSGGSGGDSGDVNNTVTGNVLTRGGDSKGVIAQSVGGGGGNGGLTVSGNVTLASKAGGAVAVGIGGSGGGGGVSGNVVNTVNGKVTTVGASSDGVIAQSIAGGGGNGSITVTGAISATKDVGGAIGVGVGGSGGVGSDAGTVFNTVNGDVTTFAEDSSGVLAQSVGGGGGNGGLNVSGAVALSGKASGSVAVGVGGAGAGGGNANRVDNYVNGNVSTRGDSSDAIIAQSIGGGGGTGGINISGALNVSQKSGGAIGIGVGGSGGGAGNGGVVFNRVVGDIYTDMKESIGVLAQSVGGGGGNGGMNVTAAIAASIGSASSTSGSVGVGIGGMGGGGGTASLVTNNVTGSVQTRGDNSTAILGQSLGGGGGNGAMNVSGAVNLAIKGKGAAVGVGVGGFGGGGGDSSDVFSTVVASESGQKISTLGDNSLGVVAQSIAGGGGNGGLNVTGVLSFADSAGGAIGVGVGGFGGGGGNSGNVDLEVTGDIQTAGSNSTAVLAQSLAGGGGNGGLNVSGAISISATKNSSNASIGIGGFGGNGGDAGDVSVAYEGTINSPWTNGTPDSSATGSHGILAQSLGGGGGNGALNISGGLSYSSTQAGNALVVGIGGFGGGGGTAGAVDLTVTGGDSITAHGDQGSAVFAQSLGGGGGNGGINISGGFTSSSPVVFGVGGFGGAGGTADTVSVSVESDLYANGENSTGITAQSLGGGGGNGALSIAGGGSFNAKKSSSSLVFGVGGFGGAAAVSDDTTVIQKGSIKTLGDWGHGIMAQSLAGGGGNGGLNVAVGVNGTNDPSKKSQDFSVVGGIGGFGGEGANAGNVAVTSTGNISTTGDHARGIFAQSVGGGGGTGGMNVTSNIAQNSSPITMGIGGFGSGGGHAGSVSVTRGSVSESAGKITTNGLAAHGIEASSIGGGGGDAGMNFSFTYTSAGNGTNGKKDKKSERSTPKNTGVDDSVIGNYNAVLDELEGRQSGGGDTTGKKAYAAQLMIGGSGGESGDGGAVDVHNFGDIETSKNMSHGVFAQSIGGGGGNASFNIAYTKANNVDKSVNLALGGATGDGGIGGNVYAEHLGKIITRGSNSVGVFAQSVGGGGGNAGMDMVASSASQGNFGVTMGRRGGTGGYGGNVGVVSGGEIATFGLNSYGIQAQSVGNGGGNSSSVSVNGPLPSSSKGTSRAGSLSVGLEGGVGGYAGDVDVTAAGKITTDGEAAHGIFAQSVGGGGGNGGDASLGSIVDFFLPATEGQNYGLAVGGKGGIGGYGGKVDVDSSAIISTAGKGAMGILAQSIGGGGGSGGKSTRFGKLKNNGNVSVNVGGSGGTGATGGDVSVNNTGVIVTKGQAAHGVLAQTIGGGGGQAGLVLSAVYSNATDSGSNLSLQVGGGGGDANSFSGNVVIDNSGGIETFAARSVGLFGQSVGGGGGNANMVVGLTAAQGSEGAGQKDFSLAIGGAGGTGGTGGDVTIKNTNDGTLYSGLIVTHGDGSHGIAAMSIGGGGGQGSTVISLERSKTEGSSRTLGIGGVGGEGGTSGLVTVENSGNIVTLGERAHGILAQSIGGGGGNGGDVLIVNSRPKGSTAQGIAVGGSGGDGNVSGDVKVVNSGSITTYGNSSYGILAQSIGGGGGNGAIAISNPKNAVTSLATAKAFNSLAMGGIGGTGADSGDVVVEHSGNITIEGDNSFGIYAQSVSGGGGSIGASLGNPLTSLAVTGLQLAIGALQTQGEAGMVSVVVTGDIIVNGKNSSAIFQQSVNGGGGEVEVFMDLTDSAAALGEGSVDIEDNLSIQEQIKNSVTDFVLGIGGQEVVDAAGEAVDFVQNGAVMAFGDSSSGSSVQSVGGGGGDSYIDLQLYEGQQVDVESGLGGTQALNSSGGDVNGKRTGLIGVVGSGGAGNSVQSIGGGGGISSLVFEANAVPVVASASPAVAPSGIVDLTLRMGSSGGSSNNGGQINIVSSGDAITVGDRTMAIIFQSIGAGGGQQFLAGADRVDVTLGGVDGAQGNAQAVSLINNGLVQTDGELAHGIVLQSIGGGGGLQVSDTARDAVDVTLSSDNSGDGGRIELDQTGDILVRGARSYGVLAQSIGGGGGAIDDIFLGSAGGEGSADDVIISLLGSAVTSGDRGVGLYGQSAGKAGAGDVLFNVRGDIGAAGDFSTGLIGLSQSEMEAGRVGVVLEGNAFASGSNAVGLDLALAGSDSTEDVELSAWGLSASGTNSVALRGSTLAANAGALSLQLRDSVSASGISATGVDYRSSGEESAGNIGISIGNSIVASGSSSRGLLASTRSPGTAGSISVSVGGGNVVSGSGATGMSLSVDGETASGGISVSVAGSNVASGSGATGMALSVNDTGTTSGLSVSVGGGTVASGNGARGMSLSVGSGGTSGIGVRVGGGISASGDGASGVVARAGGGSISTNVGGGVSVRGDGASGVIARAGSGSINTRVGGGVGVTGDGSVGIGMSSGGSHDIRVGGDLAAGANAATGLRSNSRGGRVGLRVGGNLIALGDQATGANIKASGGSFSALVGGSVMVSGAEAIGMTSRTFSARTTLDLAGDISVEGGGAKGIALASGRGEITAGVGGDVVALGASVVGLSGISDGGADLELALGGLLAVEGDGGRGIELLSSGSRSSGDISSVINGPASAFAGATALYVSSNSQGASGDLVASIAGNTEALGAGSAGLDLKSSGTVFSGEISAEVAGDVLVEGDSASGISARSISEGSASNVELTVAGNTQSLGSDSSGVLLLSQGENSGLVSGRFAGGAGVIGDRGVAVKAASYGEQSAAMVLLDIADSVFADGERAIAIHMESVSSGPSGDLIFKTSGDLQTFGESSRGLLARTEAGEAAGSIVADITGSTIVNGDSATGIELKAIGGASVGSVNATVGGDLLVLGSSARGIDVLLQSGSGKPSLVKSAGGLTAVLAFEAGEGSELAALDVSVAGDSLVEGDKAVAITLESVAGDTARSIALVIGGDAYATGDSGKVVEMRSQSLNRSGQLDLSIGGNAGVVGAAGSGLSMISSGVRWAGDVSLDLAGDLTAIGDQALAAQASSISESGDAGDVNVVVVGHIAVDGVGARGILLESLGAKSAGLITLDVGGSVMALGDGGVAISASSRGVSGGNIDITTAADEYLFAGINGTVFFIDGSKSSENSLLLNGPTMTEDGLLGTAVLATAGSDTVINQQMYYGQFDLGGGKNRFTNNGMFVAGPSLTLGLAENQLENNSELVIGDFGNAQSVSLKGSFVQSDSGVSHAEIDFSNGNIDQILATGSAQLSGEVRVTLIAPELIGAGEFSRVLFAGQQGVTDNGLTLIAPSTVVAQYDLDYSGGRSAKLSYKVDFGPQWLGENVRSVGDYFNRVQNAGSSAALADEVLALLFEEDETAYKNFLSSLLPDFYGEQQVQVLRSSQSFATRMLSCKQVGGNYRFVSEGSCAWVNAGYENLEHDAYDDFLGANFESEQISMGVQMAFADHWFAGIAGSYEKIDGDGNKGAWQSDGETNQLGLSLKYQPNQWKFSGVLTYGSNETDTVRSGQLVNVFTTQLDRDIDSLGIQFTGSYDFEYAAGYIRPGLELGANRIDFDDAVESGAEPLNLILEGSTDDFTWVRPTVEAGYEYSFSNETRARIYGRLGVQHYLGDDYTEVQAGLAGVDNTVAPLTTRIELGQDGIQGVFGVDILFVNEMTLQFQYRVEEADNFSVDAGHIKFSMPF